MKTGIKNSLIFAGFLAVVAGSATQASAGYFNTTPIARCEISITRTLQIGSENNDVLVLQKMLARGGFLQATPNGYFGVGTRSAVRQFQNENGLSVTGVVGESTRSAVNERLCDNDVLGNRLDDMSYGYYSNDVTYVDGYDPYARIISPNNTNPTVIATPQEYSPVAPRYSNTPVLSPSYASSPAISSLPVSFPVNSQTNSQIHSTSIVYNPASGYSYGIVPQSGSLTITAPLANTVYREGDTVTITWSSNNINASQYSVLLENTSTSQSKIVAVTANNGSVSFALTKEVLDAVCAGMCDNNQQGSFRIVMTSPVTDIAGITSAFRAAVAPITIKRPYFTSASVSISASKTPVNSGELFKLYVNLPAGDSSIYGTYSLKIRATCPTSVSSSIAGTVCGQEFVLPYTLTASQQEIPTMITNPTWYRQDVAYDIFVTNLAGQVIGTSRTVVTVNPTPFSW
jgi:peptidoglycan hydrolase-like protein with peptidoglycan-binding domain